MSPPRFYADENVPAALIHALRLGGLDVETAAEVGLIGRDDEKDHLPHFLSERRVLSTADHRFRGLVEALPARGQSHPGVIFLKRPDRTVILGAWREDIILIAECLSAEEMESQVLFVPL